MRSAFAFSGSHLVSAFSPPTLRALRKERGKSTADIAAAVGRSHFTIAEYERGRRKPSASVVADLADALDVAPGALFVGSGGDDRAA